MQDESSTNVNSMPVRLFFILTTFLCMIRYEASLYSPTDSFHPGYQTEVELVVSKREPFQSQFKIADAFTQVFAGFTTPPADLSSIYKYSMLRYRHFVSQRLKVYQSAFSPQHNLLSIIQKNNTWHQSPDDELNLIG